jgi:hypothetical protein
MLQSLRPLPAHQLTRNSTASSTYGVGAHLAARVTEAVPVDDRRAGGAAPATPIAAPVAANSRMARPAARARPLGRGPGGWDDMGM